MQHHVAVEPGSPVALARGRRTQGGNFIVTWLLHFAWKCLLKTLKIQVKVEGHAWESGQYLQGG